MKKPKRKTKTAEIWKHVAGGCMIGGSEKYPCDDTYMNMKTKKEITVASTKKAHFKMPSIVAGLDQLLKIKGVKK